LHQKKKKKIQMLVQCDPVTFGLPRHVKKPRKKENRFAHHKIAFGFQRKNCPALLRAVTKLILPAKLQWSSPPAVDPPPQQPTMKKTTVFAASPTIRRRSRRDTVLLYCCHCFDVLYGCLFPTEKEGFWACIIEFKNLANQN
jgi:hypothetical protein